MAGVSDTDRSGAVGRALRRRGGTDPRLHRIWFRDVGGPGFLATAAARRRGGAERSAGAHPRADELSVMVGLVSRDASGTDGVRECIGHRGRRLVFGLAIGDGVPALDWHFSRGGVFGVVAFYTS